MENRVRLLKLPPQGRLGCPEVHSLECMAAETGDEEESRAWHSLAGLEWEDGRALVDNKSNRSLEATFECHVLVARTWYL